MAAASCAAVIGCRCRLGADGSTALASPSATARWNSCFFARTTAFSSDVSSFCACEGVSMGVMALFQWSFGPLQSLCL